MLHTDLKVKHQTYVTTRIPLKKTHTHTHTRWPAVRNYDGTRTHLRQMYILLAKSKSNMFYLECYVYLKQSGIEIRDNYKGNSSISRLF